MPYYGLIRALIGGILAKERVQRRLAAVLAADVAGYSRLMGARNAWGHGRYTL
jgi:class 3 adenylate cyclase